MFNRRRRRRTGSIYSFLVTWLVLSMFFPMYELSGILTVLGLGLGAAYLFGRLSGRQAEKQDLRRKFTFCEIICVSSCHLMLLYFILRQNYHLLICLLIHLLLHLSRHFHFICIYSPLRIGTLAHFLFYNTSSHS